MTVSYFLWNKIPKSAAVLSEPPLSYVVIIPSFVFPINPPIDMTSFFSRICSILSILEIDSENRKFVDSILLSVIIGQSSSEIVSDCIPLLLKIRFRT